MKKMLLAFVGVLFFVNLTNAGPLDLINQKYNAGLISADQYFLNLYYYLYQPALVDLTLIPNPNDRLSCSAEIPSDYSQNIGNVSSLTQEIIRDLEISALDAANESFISSTGYFEIKFDRSSLQAGDLTDNNNNNIPDIVEKVANWFEISKAKLVDQAGFTDPLTYAPQGTKYTVIIPASDNSTVPLNTYFGSSYIGIKLYPNLMTGNDTEGIRFGEIKSAIAHEFKHAVQKASDNYSIKEKGFKHMDACWAEEFVFGESNSAYRFPNTTLPNSISSPSSGLFDLLNDKGTLSTGGGYEDFLWHLFLHERFDNNSSTSAPILKQFWDERSLHPNEPLVETYNRIFLPIYGQNSLGKVILEYYIWNYFSRTRAVQNSTGQITFGYSDAALNVTNSNGYLVIFPQVSSTDIISKNPGPVTASVSFTGSKIYKITNPTNASSFVVSNESQTEAFFPGMLAVRNGNNVTLYDIPESGSPIVVPTGSEMILVCTFFGPSEFSMNQVDFNIMTTLPPAVAVQLSNKVNNSNAGGKLLLSDQNQEVSSGSSVNLYAGYPYRIETKETTIPVGSSIYQRQNWNDLPENFGPVFNFTAGNQSQYAVFMPTFATTIESRIEGVQPGSVSFSDPWSKESTIALQGTRTVFPNMTKDEANPNKPFYEVTADATLPYSTSETGTFQYWKTTGTDELVNPLSYLTQPIVFRSPGSSVIANYKLKLRTAQPASSNSKNQRRLVVNGNTQLLVYESMSDIWVTASFDDGVTWLPEKRVTKRTGYAANPSLSALLTSGSNQKGLITWTEVNASGQTETYLQSITLSSGQLYFGWASLVSAPVDNTNRRKLNDFGFSTLPQAGASPTLSLNGSTVVIAYKGTNGYLIGGKFTIGSDLNSISGLVTRNLSTDNTSKQANVIHLDANSGFGAKDFIYYAKSNGSSEPVYQYDWDAQTTLQCDIPAPTGTGQYSCESLQASGSAGTVTFVYQGAAASGPDVLYYVKAGYNDRPVLSVRYLKGEKPSVTDQATSAYSVTGRLAFRSTDPANSGNWFSVIGSGSATSIGNLAVGMYTRDKGTGSSFMFTSSETPLASLKRYTGSGQLLKGEGGIQMNYIFNRWWADQNEVKHPVVLDFTGASVEPADSLEQGNVICAVTVVNPSDEEILVSQPDTLVNNLAISISRNGQVIRAYQPTVWSEITTQSLPDLRAGDILLFSVPGTVSFSLGFTDVELKQADGMSKRGTKEKSRVDLAAVQNEIAVYPNPFNPVTTLTVSVNTPSLVSIRVYNILGQVVADFGRNQMGAGKHSVQFDGRNLASGTYFYRVEIGAEVKTGKIQLLK